MKRILQVSSAFKALLTFILILASAGAASAQNHWKLGTEKEGIKIYTSLVPGSKIKAIKVETELDATPAQLVAVIMDVKNAPEWVYHTKSCVLVKQVSPSELYYYSEISLPWPAANRDFVAHLTVNRDPQTGIVTIQGPAVPGYVPVKKGVVRVDHSDGKWVIIPDGSSQVKVMYSIHVDPGGDLPAWLVNMFAAQGPLQIFRNLKLELQKPEYQNSTLAFIQ
ncbi:MAG TPA: START domain-containing protein [Mucilaginibacter sp.]|nr:START domain-containing protein [Mucilaginibacter sp.]